jgi:hypothetical protein
MSGTVSGTTVIRDKPTVLKGIIINSSAAGTNTIYDQTGTTPVTANTILRFVNNGAAAPSYLNLNIQCKRGLTLQNAGAVSLTFIYE